MIVYELGSLIICIGLAFGSSPVASHIFISLPANVINFVGSELKDNLNDSTDPSYTLKVLIDVSLSIGKSYVMEKQTKVKLIISTEIFIFNIEKVLFTSFEEKN